MIQQRVAQISYWCMDVFTSTDWLENNSSNDQDQSSPDGENMFKALRLSFVLTIAIYLQSL